MNEFFVSNAVNAVMQKIDWPKLAKLGGAILLVQMLFWALVFPALTPPPPPSTEEISTTDLQIASIKTPDINGLKSATYAKYENNSSLFRKGYYSVRINFELDQIPGAGLALQPRGASDNVLHFVNGHQLPQRGEMSADAPSYHRLQPSIEAVPATLLQTGKNVVESIHVFGDPSRLTTLAPPRLGEYSAFTKAYRSPLFFRNEVQFISVVVGFVIAGFLLVVVLRARDKQIPLWLFLLTLSWSLYSLFFRWAYIPIHGETRVGYYSIVLLFLSACWPIFVDVWTERGVRLFRWGIFAMLAIASALVVWRLWLSGDEMGWTHTQTLLDQVGLLFSAATFGRLVWHFISVPGEQRYWETALLFLLASLLASYLFNTMFHGQNTASLRIGQPVFLLVFAIMFFSRNIRLFRSTEQINALLQETIHKREAELAVAHERESQLVREQAHTDERQRIMRDMHDGLGSNLMSMLLAARRGRLKPERMAQGLESVVDEMRLMIDSVDSVGESLQSALRTFRERVQSRVESAGFRFDWNNEVEGELPKLGPRNVLQIFRIMQEAVTNALRHSGGDEMSIKIETESAEGGNLLISLCDNGAGMKESKITGHGLDNMKARANAIGAKVNFMTSRAGGTKVELILSVETDGQQD